jgi:hypothetical protein
MLMKDIVSRELSVEELLDMYGATLDFPDEPEEVVFDEEDEETKRANLQYLEKIHLSFGKGIRMRLA